MGYEPFLEYNTQSSTNTNSVATPYSTCSISDSQEESYCLALGTDCINVASFDSINNE